MRTASLIIGSAVMLGFAGLVAANPTTPQVPQGKASISSPGSPVLQRPGTISDWRSNAISPNETQRFVRQSGAAVLNPAAGGKIPGLPSNLLVIESLRGVSVALDPRRVSAGRAIELAEQSTPDLRVEIRAIDRPLDLHELQLLAGQRGIFSGLWYGRGTAQAEKAVVLPDGRILLRSIGRPDAAARADGSSLP